MRSILITLTLMVLDSAFAAEPAWPCFGGDGSRNNANLKAKNLPVEFALE